MSPSRYFGLDVGTKTIGVAVSDALGWTARPLKTIHRKSWAEDLGALHALKAEYDPTLLVVGLPMGSAGEMTEQARYNQRAAERIQQELDLPVIYRDESFSSEEASELLREMGMGRKKRRKKQKHSLDELAAARILQDYLDEQHRLQQVKNNQDLQE